MKTIDKVDMKPILFSTPMVKAILDNRKTQTRQAIKGFPEGVALDAIKHPYQPGQVLWVRETWTPFCINKKHCANALLSHSDYCFKASPDSTIYGCCDDLLGRLGCKWRPSIHMPKKAARLFLRVKDVRVERLQDITEEDARAEGCITFYDKVNTDKFDSVTTFDLTARDAFIETWNNINAKRGFGWKNNPWVWVIEFERVDGPDRQRLLDSLKTEA